MARTKLFSKIVWTLIIYIPLARHEAPAEARRPEGESANIDRRLVPYHAKSKRIQSRIEFIYLYASTAVLMRGIGILALVNSLQQKLILNYLN